MQRTTVLSLAAAVAAVALAALLIDGHRAHPHRQLFNVTNHVLAYETGSLTSQAARQQALTCWLVPGSQAAFLTTWLQTQVASGDRASHLSWASSRIQVAQERVDALSKSRALIDYRLTLTRHFHPRGETRNEEIVTFWLKRTGAVWKVYGLSFNFDPIDFPGHPNSVEDDLSHLTPAPSTPHGN